MSPFASCRRRRNRARGRHCVELIEMSARELSRVEVMQRIKSARLDQQEAARVLRLSVRQIKRLWRSYKLDGARGLV